ncbi:heme biosynthesis HemY N-terminal domain-containing protein [Aliikangiella sp. IMCC44653]
MRVIFFLVIAIVIGGVAGSWIKNLPGFVIIAYETTTYEMRLWVAVCIVIISLIALSFIASFVRTFFASAGRIKNWQGSRHARKARIKTIQGMLAFTEGRWKAAEEAMVTASKNSDTKLINFLIAAQAAQHQDAEVRRDAYLRKAHLAEPEAGVAIGLTQAQLQLQNDQLEQALASLTKIRATNPNHPFVLKLLARLFVRLEEWSQLVQLLPLLSKYQVFKQHKLEALETTTVKGLLAKQANKGQVEGLIDCWQNLASNLRKKLANITVYCEWLIYFEQFDTAEKLLRTEIKRQANTQLLNLYGQTKTANPNKQLSFLENWQQAQDSPPKAVFNCLGKLAYNAQLWGKARSYFEQALQLQESEEAYFYMAKTLQALGEEGLAASSFEAGLQFALSPQKNQTNLTLARGSEDLVNAELLPKFQKLENKQ